MVKTQFTKQWVKRIQSGLVAAAIGLMAALAPNAAIADTITVGVPSFVRIYGNSGNQLLRVIIGSTEFYVYATGSPQGCTDRGVDAVKEYESQAQTALLAGKNLGVAWNSCGGNAATGTPGLNYIIGLELARN